jgi:hypothetical protein
MANSFVGQKVLELRTLKGKMLHKCSRNLLLNMYVSELTGISETDIFLN